MATYSQRTWDYARVCDICGARCNASDLTKHQTMMICRRHTGERTRIELDRLNADFRPTRVWPVPNPKPQNPNSPYTFISEESDTLTFLAQMTGAGARYLNVTSGDGSSLSGEQTNTLGWTGYYLYGLVAADERPASMVLQAQTLLVQAATTLQTRQNGFGLNPSYTRAANSDFGAVLEPGETTYSTETAIMAGLTMLYAYRQTGTLSFLFGARAAASYLRNVQAIGKFGVHHTSTDAAGTGYLYTGSLCSEVATAAGFYSDHLFYPSALMALVFWKELTTTDGDQQLGATTAIAGDFSQVPQQLMSQCMTDLRACWETGIRDSTGTTLTGLSATTPREFFNAYPQSKSQFLFSGTGMWEFVDGAAAIGTQVTGRQFAKGLHALYVYEGVSSQVSSVDDWLRSFTSNPEFETPDDTSESVLARSTTGTYDPELGITTLLDVRDADADYAAIKTNGSSLYDWGAFGLLSGVWARRHGGTFVQSRLTTSYLNQRFRDGRPYDGLNFDPLHLHGRSGLSLQTAFQGSSDQPSSSGGGPGGLATGAFWYGDSRTGVTTVGSLVTRWADLSGNSRDAVSIGSIFVDPPILTPNVFNGEPGLLFSQTVSGTRFMEMNGLPPLMLAGNSPLTVYTVCIPTSSTGGCLFGYAGSGSTVPPCGTMDLFLFAGTQYGYSNFGAITAAMPNPPVDYTGVPMIIAHYTDGANVWMSINGVDIPLTPNVVDTTPAASNGYFVGGMFMTGGLSRIGFDGYILAQAAWNENLRGTSADLTNTSFLGTSWNISGGPVADPLGAYVIRDALRASQIGLAYRYSPVSQGALT